MKGKEKQTKKEIKRQKAVRSLMERKQENKDGEEEWQGMVKEYYKKLGEKDGNNESEEQKIYKQMKQGEECTKEKTNEEGWIETFNWEEGIVEWRMENELLWNREEVHAELRRGRNS